MVLTLRILFGGPAAGMIMYRDMQNPSLQEPIKPCESCQNASTLTAF